MCLGSGEAGLTAVPSRPTKAASAPQPCLTAAASIGAAPRADEGGEGEAGRTRDVLSDDVQRGGKRRVGGGGGGERGGGWGGWGRRQYSGRRGRGMGDGRPRAPNDGARESPRRGAGPPTPARERARPPLPGRVWQARGGMPRHGPPSASLGGRWGGGRGLWRVADGGAPGGSLERGGVSRRGRRRPACSPSKGDAASGAPVAARRRRRRDWSTNFL